MSSSTTRNLEETNVLLYELVFKKKKKSERERMGAFQADIPLCSVEYVR